MTTVLASTAMNGDAIVMASDRMVARAGLAAQWEHDTPKIRVLGRFLIGYTGTASVGDDIISHDYENLNGTTKEFIEEFSAFYVRYGNRIASREILESVGLTPEDFSKSPGAYPPALQQRVYDGMGKPKLNVQFIVCGYDGDQPKMYLVGEHGIFTTAHSIGYAAVGIGEPYASNFYVVNGYRRDMPLKQAIYFAYRAKRSAEIAGGVGKCTDISILEKGRKSAVSYRDGSPFITELNRIYDRHQAKINILFEREVVPEVDKLETGGRQ